MTTLVDFPMINQLSDGDINAIYDCVPASLAAGISYLSAKKVSSSELKDAVYGQSYKGPTAIGQYRDVCSSYGIQLSSILSIRPQDALRHAHSMLYFGRPILFTQQDDYAQSHPEWTHVCIWYADTENSLTAMDPMGGKALTYSDEIWASRLRDTTIWTMEKTMTAPSLWKDEPTNTTPTLTAPNGIPIVAGFRDYILRHPDWDSRNYPIAKEEGRNPLEESNLALGGGTQQLFRYRPLEWTPSTGVFEAWTGSEILFLRSTIATLQAQTLAQDKTIADLDAQIMALRSKPLVMGEEQS